MWRFLYRPNSPSHAGRTPWMVDCLAGGTITTVWDAEVTAIAETLRRCKGGRLLILSDSKAAIAAIVKAGKRG